MRILIIEDHSGIRLALEMIFEIEGHYAVSVDRGEDGLSLVEATAEPFDVVLLDLNTNGITAAEFMQSLTRLCDMQGSTRPQVGILSGSAAIEKETQRIGADFMIRKPFEQEQVLAAIEKVSSSRSAEGHLAHAQA